MSALANLIKGGIREEDIVCRYGGEEFILILPGASLQTTRERAESLRRAVHDLVIEHRDQLIKATTISLGVAIFPDHGASGDEVMAAADAALYCATQAGRDRVEIATLRSPGASAL